MPDDIKTISQVKEISGDPEDKRDTHEFWRRFIKKAKDAAADHQENARAAWREYEKINSQTGTSVLSSNAPDARPYPIYWSSCRTLEPAYYSRTPKILSKRRAGVTDPVASTMCLVVERLGDYFVDITDFDDVMQAAVLDFIHGDKACPQVSYVEEPKKVQVQVPLIPDGDQLIEEDGTPFEGEPEQDEQGNWFYTKSETQKNYVIKLMPCPYDEILHTPDAKCEAEINEKAYYFFMNKEEAEKRFPDKTINWKSGRRDRKDPDKLERDNIAPIGKYVEGWECWSKSNEKVYWISEQFMDGFLDSKDDPYKLRGFFPSPKFIIGNRPSKHLYPTPVFVQLFTLIEELHSAAARISVLINRVRRRALVDGANPELELALNQLSDGEYVAVENLQQILEKGGMDNLVWFIPVKELVDAITELSGIQEKFKNEFFEWFGVPDILRGQTDPVETAAAQEMKVSAAHDRFKFCKKLVARMARDSIEMMIDLALTVMDDEQLADICNVSYMEPEHQQRFAEALSALRADDIRTVRVDIDTDSMSFLDDQLRAAKINDGVATLSRGLEQIAQMVQTSPDYANVALQALLLSLEAMGLGKEFEDMVRASVAVLIQKAMNPPQPPPPPPDYEMLKIQVEQSKVQSQSIAKQRELDQAEMKLQLQSGELAAQNNVEMMKAQTEAQRLQIEGFKAQLDDVVQHFMMQVEGQRVQIEQYKAEQQARESQMEEIRLAREVEVKQYAELVKAAQTQGPAETPPPQIFNIQPAAMPPINLAIDAKQGLPPSSKEISVVRDELGNAVAYRVTETAPVPSAIPILPIG
jgi:hypothetical protein